MLKRRSGSASTYTITHTTASTQSTPNAQYLGQFPITTGAVPKYVGSCAFSFEESIRRPSPFMVNSTACSSAIADLSLQRKGPQTHTPGKASLPRPSNAGVCDPETRFWVWLCHVHLISLMTYFRKTVSSSSFKTALFKRETTSETLKQNQRGRVGQPLCKTFVILADKQHNRSGMVNPIRS